MVNDMLTAVDGSSADRMAERRLLLSHFPARVQPAITALLELDGALGAILRSTREPMVGQMRLTWWHAALTALDTAPAPAQPVLQALAQHVVAVVPGAVLAKQVEGWEELVDPEPLDGERLNRYAEGRGVNLFHAIAQLLGDEADDAIAAAGRGWALADLAANLRDAETVGRARALADRDLSAAMACRWRRRIRPLGIMALFAAMPAATLPAKAGRAVWHRLTGR